VLVAIAERRKRNLAALRPASGRPRGRGLSSVSMDRSTPRSPSGGSTRAETGSREDRLKAALKANLARRKAQARARAGEDAGREAVNEDDNGQG